MIRIIDNFTRFSDGRANEVFPWALRVYGRFIVINQRRFREHALLALDQERV